MTRRTLISLSAVALTATVLPFAYAQKEVLTSKHPLMAKAAPDFTLPDQNDKPVSLKDSKGKWTVIAFYPKDASPVCTAQNRSYSKNVDAFKKKGVVVYTVSTQDTVSKKEFCSKDSLKHTLLSDVGGKVAGEYDAMMPGSTFANRMTFYISPAGKVAYVDQDIQASRAAQESLDILAQLMKPAKPVAMPDKVMKPGMMKKVMPKTHKETK